MDSNKIIKFERDKRVNQLRDASREFHALLGWLDVQLRAIATRMWEIRLDVDTSFGKTHMRRDPPSFSMNSDMQNHNFDPDDHVCMEFNDGDTIASFQVPMAYLCMPDWEVVYHAQLVKVYEDARRISTNAHEALREKQKELRREQYEKLKEEFEP